MDIVDRLRFDAVRCEVTFSKGVAGNISEAVDEIDRLRADLDYVRTVLDECKNDFHTCGRCGEQDDDATKTSNLWLMLTDRLSQQQGDKK